jgi:phosphohistidine phosphatase
VLAYFKKEDSCLWMGTLILQKKRITRSAMQRHLLIMRHAQAEEIQRDQSDRNRELTSKGQHDALQMAYYLSEQKMLPDAIYSSASARTQKTASLLSDVFKLNSETFFIEEDLYNSSIRTYLSFISRLNNEYKTILLVGHNPTVSYLVEYLSGAEIISIPTAGACIIRFDSVAWSDVDKGRGELLDFMYPEKLI